MEAEFIWCNQSLNILLLLYEGATTGIGGVLGKLVARQTPGERTRTRTTSDRTHHGCHELAMRLFRDLSTQSPIHSIITHNMLEAHTFMYSSISLYIVFFSTSHMMNRYPCD